MPKASELAESAAEISERGPRVFSDAVDAPKTRHRLTGYLAQRVPSLVLASSFTMCLNVEVLKGIFPWRARYPLSLQVPMRPAPKDLLLPSQVRLNGNYT